MKSNSPHIDKFAIDRLRFELLKKVGWSISSKRDCFALSELILKSGYGQLSESTIYRLFFQFGKHVPYKSTLDILCKFLDYRDSIHYLKNLDGSRQELHFSGVNTFKKSLIFSCIENTAKNPLLDFFEETNENTHQFKTDVSVSIFDSLVVSTKQNWFFKHFAHQNYVREYFFERGHDTKFRIKNYDKAYLLYLKGINPDKDICKFQEYIFGNCVLFRHYFITGKRNQARDIAKSLYANDLSNLQAEQELYIYPYIRYIAYKLFYLELKEESLNKLEEYAMFLNTLCNQMKNNLTYTEQKIVFHTVAESFVYSSIPIEYHEKLKNVFIELYKAIPPLVYKKHLKYSLPYFNENGLLHFRP